MTNFDLFSFLSGAASILGLFVSIYGLYKGGKYLAQKIRIKGSQNISHGQAIGKVNAGRDVFNVNYSGAINKEELEKLYTVKKFAQQSENVFQINPEIDKLTAQLEEKLEKRSSISCILLATKRVAERRKDNDILQWLDLELNGYIGKDLSTLDRKMIKHRMLEGYFIMATPTENHQLPIPFFQGAGIDLIESMIDNYNSIPKNQRPEAIPFLHETPKEIIDFLTEMKRESKPDLVIPERLMIFVEPSRFDKLFAAIRQRVMEYLSTIS